MLAATCRSAASSSHTFAPPGSDVLNAIVLPSGLNTALPGPLPADPDEPGTSTRRIPDEADPGWARARAPTLAVDEDPAGRPVFRLARKWSGKAAPAATMAAAPPASTRRRGTGPWPIPPTRGAA